MKPEVVEARPVEEEGSVTLGELAELSGLSERELQELVDHGVFGAVDAGTRSWTFSARYVVVARKACRLGREFELDPHAVAVLLGFLDRIDALQREVLDLRAHLSRTP